MRAGNFELAVTKEDGTPFPEVTDGERTYAVAAAGQTYELRATWLGDECPLPDNHTYQVGCLRGWDLDLRGTWTCAAG